MDCLSGWCRSERRLEGCTAIVTGSNTGIGKETALDFYGRGARVIMACRSVDKAEAAKQDIEQKSKSNKVGTLVVEKLDLCSLDSVRDFVKRVLEKESAIQILVNNAGVMMVPEGKTEDGFETHIGSNHFGHALLTLMLLPTMIKSAPSRIVNVSSYLHKRHELPLDDINFEKTPYDGFVAYCRSKGANLLFAKGLARKLKEHNIEGVTTYSLHPGLIRTDLSRNLNKTVWSGATWAYDNLLGLVMKSPRCGAQTQIYCAVDEKCANESGLYYSDCKVTRPSRQCRDEKQADQLWDITVDTLKYDPFVKDITSH